MNKIKIYSKKLFVSYLSNYYKSFIIKTNLIYINYFYWYLGTIYTRSVEGLCVKYNLKHNNIMQSFILYYKYKNVKINQLYFINSPFNLFLKCKLARFRNYKLYIL